MGISFFLSFFLSFSSSFPNKKKINYSQPKVCRHELRRVENHNKKQERNKKLITSEEAPYQGAWAVLFHSFTSSFPKKIKMIISVKYMQA
jgi:hypothetical protein